LQQAEQQVVLPDAIDAEIASRQTFAVKSAFSSTRIDGALEGMQAASTR